MAQHPLFKYCKAQELGLLAYITELGLLACKLGFLVLNGILSYILLGFYNPNPASVVRTVWLDPRSRSAAASVDLHS